MDLNKFWLGFSVGVILPILAFIISFAYMSSTKEVSSFLSQLGAVGIKTSFLSMVAMPNFLAFFAFYYKNYNQSARGVVVATGLATAALVMIECF